MEKSDIGGLVFKVLGAAPIFYNLGAGAVFGYSGLEPKNHEFGMQFFVQSLPAVAGGIGLDDKVEDSIEGCALLSGTLMGAYVVSLIVGYAAGKIAKILIG